MDAARQDGRVQVLIREVRQVSELFLVVRDALERDRADLIFGLTLSQVQLLATQSLLQPIAGREIETKFSRYLYVSPSAKANSRLFSSDQIIAAPINVTFAAVCYDKRNVQVARMMERQKLSIEDIATGRDIARVAFPDPRFDPVGRAVLLSAFLNLNVHSGWSLIEALDAKVDSYARSYSPSCSEVDSESKEKRVDVAFTTVDTAAELRLRNPLLGSALLSDAIPVSDLFAAVLRNRPSIDSSVDVAVTRVFAQLTGTLLERQKVALLPNFSLDWLYGFERGVAYRTGQTVDEWAARYDNKSLAYDFGK
jgi:hypothetical protein